MQTEFHFQHSLPPATTFSGHLFSPSPHPIPLLTCHPPPSAPHCSAVWKTSRRVSKITSANRKNKGLLLPASPKGRLASCTSDAEACA